MRVAVLSLLILPLAACAGGGRSSPAKASVDAVVLDEGKRAEAAQTAQSTASSTAGMGAVSEGPKDQAPVP
ncbi:hypothetical protein [Phenylobacterium deserti]|uniref:Uncharacterized protein n=1 Tax=Phenylobacterium deserti TaxID=1914756 RepID=A0A328ARL1_9CAUL|nr:hypothetical protein [Phenylobacterium deserti]RAK56945.1 hypothetical protein DJ018_02965 [Phenylobacterium deserti]